MIDIYILVYISSGFFFFADGCFYRIDCGRDRNTSSYAPVMYSLD